VNSTFDKGNTQKATDESITMAKTRRTPRPQKSPAKAKAAVNKMKGAATTAPRSPDEPDKPDVPEEAEAKVGIESVVWDHSEAEQKIKADEISVDDGTTGIQSVLEAAAAVVALSGATRKKSAPAVGAKKPNAKKPSPSKRKTLAQKPAPPVTTRYFGYVSLNFAGTRLNMAQQLFLHQNMVRTMYLQIGSIISGRGTQVIYWRINTRIA
jgi:hypothetical protein